MSADADNNPQLTVGSLLGMPLGAVPPPPEAASASISPPAASTDLSAEENEGPNWTVSEGVVSVGRPVAWQADGVEALTFNNPFGQVMERVWFDGKIVYAVDLGKVVVDPIQVKVAQEYQPVYSVQLDENGRSVGDPEFVEGQLNMYDTVPGMDRYSPIWQFEYVIVPRDYKPNTLRSEGDCLASGYSILKSQDFEN
jgi:hypothetical protein